jgi:hypothetical protein
MTQPRAPGKDLSEFTEEGYRTLLRRAKARFRFAAFGEQPPEPHVLWRHDVDTSVHRALALARIEAQEGVRATYFLMLRSEFYNLFEAAVLSRAREIAGLGHQIGLHFSFPPGVETQPKEDALRLISWELGVLQELLGTAPTAVSFHNLAPDALERFNDSMVGGVVNAYGTAIFRGYTYCSDSNGYWRFASLGEQLQDPAVRRLQVLTHPEWWTPEVLTPRQKIARSIDGRAQALHRFYDGLIAQLGRTNAGKETDIR